MTSRLRTLISVFLVFHLVALALSAIPSPADLEAAVGVRASSDDRLSGLVRPTLDQAAVVVRAAPAVFARVSSFTTPLIGGYVSRLGLNQTWNMFGNPPRGSEYVRFRYYWTRAAASEDGSVVLSTELAFPMAAPGEARLFRSYWQSQRDKAGSNAVTAYFVERTRRMSNRGAGPAPSLDQALARTFLPMVGYFSDRFARTRLAPGDRLVRTEVWYGWAESRPRGGNAVAPQSRAAVLEKYFTGIPDERVSTTRFTAVDRLEREADIQWAVLYVRTP